MTIGKSMPYVYGVRMSDTDRSTYVVWLRVTMCFVLFFGFANQVASAREDETNVGPLIVNPIVPDCHQTWTTGNRCLLLHPYYPPSWNMDDDPRHPALRR